MAERMQEIEKLENQLKEEGEVGIFVINLVNLTGREMDDIPRGDDLARALQIINHIYENVNKIRVDDLLEGKKEQHDLFYQYLNQALGALGFETIDNNFYNIVFKQSIIEDFYKIFDENICSDIEEYFEKSTLLFRQFCMFYFGNFKFGYRKFRKIPKAEDSILFKEMWDDFFKEKAFTPRPEFDGLEEVDIDLRWSLGYLAVKYGNIVSDSRKKLLPILQDGLNKKCKSLEEIKKKTNLPDNIYFESYLPPEANLLPYYDSMSPFEERIKNAIDFCQQDVEARLEDMQKIGRQNMFNYLTLSNIDIYFATSMRSPGHFYNTYRLIDTLFKKGELSKYNLRVFDPTNSFSHDRLDKGLMECLMVARSKMTVYNAQETDTFGKDVEAALSLVLHHPVIIYVARLFETTFEDIYNTVDIAKNKSIDEYFNFLKENHKLSFNELDELQKEPLTKERLIDKFLDVKIPKLLEKLTHSEVLGELDSHGYSFTDVKGKSHSEIIEHTIEIIKKLEKRAIVFLEGHPLSMLASPQDGVARGIIITRTVKKTSEIIHDILTNQIKYTIQRDKYGWRLIEKSTESPIRIITADKQLTSAFWDNFLRD